MNSHEYQVNLRVLTDWHEPHNTTTHNDYVEFVEAVNAKTAAKKAFSMYSGVLTNPNKSIEIKKVRRIDP